MGVGPMECMQVKEDPDGDYTFFYQQIEGFEFEPGYEYELLVQVDQVENPPADGSSLKYTLIEVVSKTPVDTAAGAADDEAAAQVEEIVWDVTSFVNADGEMVEPIPGAEPTLRMEDGQIGGSGSCNNYFGSYTLDGDRLTIEQVGATMMACPEPLMNQETAFLAALGSVASYSLDGDTLTLLDSDGNPVVVLAPQQQLPLVGINWQVTGYNNGTGGFTSVLADTELTALFDDANVSGSAGCNNYSAGYETNGHTISIGLAITTMKMCPEEIMTQESAFLAALAMAATYDIQADTLTLFAEDGARAVEFVAAPDEEVQAGSDEVTDLGDMALPSEFGEDGQIQFKDGVFIGPPIAPGSATRVTATLTDFVTEGELDGEATTAAILVVNSGGTGSFYDLVALQGTLENPSVLTDAPLGDRVEINSLTIEDNQIVVDMINQGPDDAMCCPTQNVIRTYALQDGELVQTSEEVVGSQAATSGEAQADASPVEGVTWQAVSFVNAEGETVDALADAAPTLSFADGQLSGSDGCNSFSGSATISDGAVEFGPLASTAMACIGPVGEQAAAFQAALGQAVGYQVTDDGMLELGDADGNIVATFVVQEVPALVGTTWSATGVNNGRGGVQSLAAGTEITALFGEDGTLSGNDGCNDYNASYTVDGDSIAIAMGPSTLMACPEEIMTQASAYQAALGNATTFSISGDRLELRDADGALQVSFVAQEMPALTGMTWSAMGVNNGRGGVQSLLAETEITALFAGDGTVAGSAGCNQYSAPYTVDGDAIEIGDAITTRMMCPEPMMEQETAYLAALGNATTFSLGGDRLELRDADGAVLQVDYLASDDAAMADDAMSAVEEGVAMDVAATELPAASDAIALEPGVLATSYHWRVAPATEADASPASGPTGLPAHVVITFDNQTPDQAVGENGPMIHVIPVAEYATLMAAAASDDVAEQVATLQTLLEERPSAPATPLRLLPYSIVANDPAVQAAFLDAAGFSGLRYVDPAGTDDASANYAFQGLDNDGKFLIAVRWPVTGSGDEWRPNLAQIDALIESLNLNASFE